MSNENTESDSKDLDVSKASMNDKLNFIVMITVTTTLSIVIVAMVITLMIGLFDTKVDNIEIFKLITPAFQTVIGGFIGILAGIKIGKS